jgi:hypothetical protein
VGSILAVCPVHLTKNSFFYKEDRWAVSLGCAQYTLQKIPSFIKKTGGQYSSGVPSTLYNTFLILSQDRQKVSFRCAQYTLQKIPSFIKKTGGQ